MDDETPSGSSTTSTEYGVWSNSVRTLPMITSSAISHQPSAISCFCMYSVRIYLRSNVLPDFSDYIRYSVQYEYLE
jgi:hypothetical protein